MWWRVRAITFSALVLVLIAPSAQAVDPIRSFQIDVIAINTAYGSPVVTEENSKAIIDKINIGMDDSTGGLIRFTFRTLYPPITPNIPVLDTSDFISASGIKPQADPGFEKAILVGVMARNPTVAFAGQAGGRFMLINGEWTTANALTVTHELGHNMAIGHSNSAVCTNQIPITCDVLEYGDYSSVMGRYLYGYTSSPYIARFSATELDLLKVLPASKRLVAVDSGQYSIAPVYSSTGDLPKVIYIPIGNENSYSIEYRPATGVEAALAQTQIFLTNGGYYKNIPSHGIQLRLLALDSFRNATASPYASIQPKLTNPGALESALITDSFTGAQVQPMGKSFLLSDGTSVTFVSADPTTGAVIKVVRPADSEGPRITSSKATWVGNSWWVGPNGEWLVRHKSATELIYPALELPISDVTDNRLVKSVALEINGKVVDQIPDVSKSTIKNFRYQTSEIGAFAARLIATDYAGNKTEGEISKLSTALYVLPRPGVAVNPGANPYNSLKFSFYKVDAAYTYKLSELSSGTIKSTEVNNGIVTITVGEIAPNTVFTARLTGVDTSGNTDDGQIVTGSPYKSGNILTAPDVVANPGADPTTSLMFSFYKVNTDYDYQLTELSAGTLKSADVVNGVVVINIENIPRNSSITAKLTGTDAFGNSDGGQLLSGTPTLSVCSNSACFTGFTWRVDTGIWSAGSGTLTLQEKIKGKWVVIKSSKPLTGFSTSKKYPVTYSITLSNAVTGSHTYRFVIAATKKSGAYTGKEFVQIVKP